MKYSIDPERGESLYLQLYHELKQGIVTGELPAGMKLPSKRVMAEELNISVITVEHSYGLLVDEGYIESREKSGYYVCFGIETPETDAKAEPEADFPDPPEPITEAPEDFPFSVLSRVMRRVLADKERQILSKSPNSGLQVLRETLTRYLLRTRGIRVLPSQIVIGSGAEYLYSLIVQLLGTDRRYAVENPCYDRIPAVYGASGAEVEALELGKEGIRTAALQSCTASVLHVTPWDSFPSGVTASAAKRHAYISWAKKDEDRLIVEDDYGSEFASPTRQIDTLFALAPDRVIYINTFTKTLAPSMRMGYMVLPPHLAAEFHEKLGFYSCTVPVFEQYVLEELIREGHLERYISVRKRKMKSGRR